MALAAWLFAGVMVDFASRIRLFRVSPVESLRRARRQIVDDLQHGGAFGIGIAASLSCQDLHRG